LVECGVQAINPLLIVQKSTYNEVLEGIVVVIKSPTLLRKHE
jgi:hypothetical protein